MARMEAARAVTSVAPPFVGRVGLDVRQPEPVSLSVIANARRAALCDLDEAQRHQGS
jgi:hypothetical protein